MRIRMPQSGDPPQTGSPAGWLEQLSTALNPPLPKIAPRQCGPDAKCCEKSDLKTRRDCLFCTAPCCNYCRGLYNGRWICKACRDQIKAKFEAEKATWTDMPRALMGGFGLA